MLEMTCIACQSGHHEACMGGQNPPEGVMGGWRCVCPCPDTKTESDASERGS